MKISGADMSMIRGDTETIAISCTNSEGNIVPFQIGDKIYFTLKENIYDVENILQKVIVEFIEGVAIIELSHDDTKKLRCSTYKYDIRLIQNHIVITLVPAALFMIQREVNKYD